MSEENTDENLLYKIFAIVIIICAIFEAVIFGIAYFGADEVSCNFLWCEFKTTRTISSSTSTEDCFRNGERINCSEMDRQWN